MTPLFVIVAGGMGGILGLLFRHYCRHFKEQVEQEIYTSYHEIFPDAPTLPTPTKSALSPLKCGSNFRCFVLFSTLFLSCALFIKAPWLAAIIALKISLLATISLLDFQYRLIPTTLCQQLMALGLFAAYMNILPFNLAESLFSLFLGFSLFWLVYHWAKWRYQAEAFGRGDYWLIGSLASFQPWEQLPSIIFIACLSALVYAGWQRWRRRPCLQIPFAPFLCFGALASFGLNWWH